MTNHLPSCLKLETTDVCGLQLCFQGHNSGRSQPVARVNTNLADLCSNGFGSCRTTNGGPCPHDPERPLAFHFRFGEKMLIIHCCFESGDHHFVKRSHHFSKKQTLIKSLISIFLVDPKMGTISVSKGWHIHGASSSRRLTLAAVNRRISAATHVKAASLEPRIGVFRIWDHYGSLWIIGFFRMFQDFSGYHRRFKSCIVLRCCWSQDYFLFVRLSIIIFPSKSVIFQRIVPILQIVPGAKSQSTQRRLFSNVYMH